MSLRVRDFVSTSWPALAALCGVLVVGCGEDTGDGPHPDTDQYPALIVVSAPLNTRPGGFDYAKEIGLLFSVDPGTVVLDYDGATPLHPVVGTGTKRSFLLERSRTVLRWDHGGEAVLEYDPVIIPQTRVPHIAHAWPKLGAQHIEFDKINNRSDIELGFPMPVSVGDVIPKDARGQGHHHGPRWRDLGAGRRRTVQSNRAAQG